MKVLFIFLISIFFIGCSSKVATYILQPSNITPIANSKVQIGVKKVKLPNYLDNEKILVKEGVKVEELDAKFVDTPSSILTHNAITTLKRVLNNPNVFLYPWDVKNKKGYIVEIKIENFIYQNGNTILSGSYYIKMSNGKIIAENNFFYKKLSKKEPQAIVENLSYLFNKLILEIAQKIAK